VVPQCPAEQLRACVGGVDQPQRGALMGLVGLDGGNACAARRLCAKVLPCEAAQTQLGLAAQTRWWPAAFAAAPSCTPRLCCRLVVSGRRMGSRHTHPLRAEACVAGAACHL
jgi:hypothetical protein